MNDVIPFALSLIIGTSLGTLFFGGLWWTVQRGTVSEWPAFWFLGSLLTRTGIVLAGFALVSQGHWTRLAACLLGFLAARIVVVRWIAKRSNTRGFLADSGRLERLTIPEEASHAS
jgi:F1F0 ATPase subunit 2